MPPSAHELVTSTRFVEYELRDAQFACGPPAPPGAGQCLMGRKARNRLVASLVNSSGVRPCFSATRAKTWLERHVLLRCHRMLQGSTRRLRHSNVRQQLQGAEVASRRRHFASPLAAEPSGDPGHVESGLHSWNLRCRSGPSAESLAPRVRRQLSSGNPGLLL